MPKRKSRTPARGPYRKYHTGKKYWSNRGKYKRYKNYGARKVAALKYLKGSAKFKAAVRKRKRALKRKRKVNKAIGRVLTSMNDEKRTMYRQYINPLVEIPGTTTSLLALDQVGPITDGDYVATDNEFIRKVIGREDRDFFQINAFHGYCAPSYQLNPSLAVNRHLNNMDGATEDDVTMLETGVGTNATAGTQPTYFNHNASDIRAYKEIEIPLIPCIPSHDRSIASKSMYQQAFDRFQREGEKIKITNNYMRFDFFAVRNGELQYHPSSHATHANQPSGITGDNTNIDYTFSAGGMQEYVTSDSIIASVTSNKIVTSAINKTKEYKIIAPRYAKVRIILWERECYHKDKVVLSDFLKDDKKFLMMGTDEYKQNEHFKRGLKNKRDLTAPTDGADTDIVDQLMAKMKGKLIIDKTCRLPMNKKKTLIFNPLKGKVLTYDPLEPRLQYDEGSTGRTEVLNVNEYSTIHLPVGVNSIRGSATAAQLTEYMPKNKQYGMFMLFDVQRCAVEYDIFQKFEYDK